VAASAEPVLELDHLVCTSREAPAATMLVLRDPGEVFLLRHTGGADAISWVERIDPITLEPLARSADLPGGPAWPGGLAAHADGSLHVAFGNHVHRLSAELEHEASATMPRRRPYNSFVVLPDGHLVTKDFGGALPGDPEGSRPSADTEVVVLDPRTLAVVASAVVPEGSIARLSAGPADDGGHDVYVVGTTSLWRLRWDGAVLVLDPDFSPEYRTLPGQTYGWDPVLALGAAWFLDDGEGSERFAGTFRGLGISPSPLHLVRVDLTDGRVSLTEVCGEPDGIVANPPLVDEARHIAVAYDSSNAVLAAFDVAADGSLTPRWRRVQDHACHMILLTGAGLVVTNDFDAAAGTDHVVLVDIGTGDERARIATGSPIQSVLFPAVGWHDDLYVCSFTTVSRIHAS
jgi:hypothetical protein